MPRRKEATALIEQIAKRAIEGLYETEALIKADLYLLEMELLYDWGGPPQENGFFWYRDKKGQPEIVGKVFFDSATSSWIVAFAGSTASVNVSELSGQWARVSTC